MSNQVFSNITHRYSGGRAKYHLLNNQSIEDTTFSTVLYDVIDQDTIKGLTYNAGVWTCTEAGTYHFILMAMWGSNGIAGNRQAIYDKNNVPTTPNKWLQPVAAASFSSQIISHVDVLVIGDTVRFTVYQDTGIAVDMLGITLSAANFAIAEVYRLV